MPIGLFVVSDERWNVSAWEIRDGTVHDRQAPRTGLDTPRVNRTLRRPGRPQADSTVVTASLGIGEERPKRIPVHHVGSITWTL
jgi:hypothetical protein